MSQRSLRFCKKHDDYSSNVLAKEPVPEVSLHSIMVSPIYNFFTGHAQTEAESVPGRNSSETDREICDQDHQLCRHQGDPDMSV